MCGRMRQPVEYECERWGSVGGYEWQDPFVSPSLCWPAALCCAIEWCAYLCLIGWLEHANVKRHDVELVVIVSAAGLRCAAAIGLRCRRLLQLLSSVVHSLGCSHHLSNLSLRREADGLSVLVRELEDRIGGRRRQRLPLSLLLLLLASESQRRHQPIVGDGLVARVERHSLRSVDDHDAEEDAWRHGDELKKGTAKGERRLEWSGVEWWASAAAGRVGVESRGQKKKEQQLA